jgi:signal transduction histidine kinase
MFHPIDWLLSSDNFMPHGHCYLWQPGTLWLNVGSDALIACSYFAIPIAIYFFASQRRAAIRYAWIPMMFAAFILLCGGTHVMEIWTVWHPIYRVAGGLKLLTGLASFATLLTLIWIMPRALLLKTPGQLEAEVAARTLELNQANTQLRAEIAARDAASRKLLATNQQLERSNRDLEDFAYIASHDLKTPLAGVKSAALCLEEDLHDLSEESQKLLGLMRNRIDRMEALLDDLLAYSRVGRVDTAVSETRLEDVVARIVEVLNPPGHIRIRVEGELPVIVTASAQLEQVLRNLIGNAIKHHDKPSGEVVLSAKRVGDFVEFIVRDDGPGILPQFHNKVFELFQTLKRRGGVESTGMGLAIVKKLIERQNCRVTVHSQGDGTGTEFRFQWPTSPTGIFAMVPANPVA